MHLEIERQHDAWFARGGVALGLLVGVLTILLLDGHHVHGQLGGILAASATGVVIFIVSQLVDRR